MTAEEELEEFARTHQLDDCATEFGWMIEPKPEGLFSAIGLEEIKLPAIFGDKNE